MTPPSDPGFTVLVLDLAQYADGGGVIVSGFPTRDEAVEYARRRVRSSLEELRAPGQSKAELKALWWIYGEDARVLEPDGYSGSSELEILLNHPATAEECDWQAMEKRLGARLRKLSTSA